MTRAQPKGRDVQSKAVKIEVDLVREYEDGTVRVLFRTPIEYVSRDGDRATLRPSIIISREDLRHDTRD